VNVLYGGASGLTGSRAQQLNQGSAGGAIENGDHFGAALAAGRFDAGPRSDLAVGAPEEDAGGQADAGYVDLLYGTTGGLSRNGARELGQSSSAGANESGDRFGAALSSGDYDGDGLTDLAAGAPGEDVASIVDAGAVNVLYGSAAGGIVTTRARQLTQAQAGGSAEEGDGFGSALASARFDGDTPADLAVGAPGEDNGSVADAGGVNVLYGGASGVGSRSQALSQGNGAGQVESGDRFGEALSAGNLNGDGYGDLEAGAPGEDGTTLTDIGAVNLVYGASAGLTASGAQQLTQSTGGSAAEQGDGFGAALR
jgi:hypothetical protein